jgi:hypothetical protein
VLIGDGNTVVNVSLTMTNNGGLEISGDHNHVENILVDNTDWLGTLSYVPLTLSGNHNTLLRSTIRRFGNAGVVTNIPNTVPNPQPSTTECAGVLHVCGYGLTNVGCRRRSH